MSNGQRPSSRLGYAVPVHASVANSVLQQRNAARQTERTATQALCYPSYGARGSDSFAGWAVASPPTGRASSRRMHDGALGGAHEQKALVGVRP